MNYTEEVGSRIKTARLKKGITLKELGNHVGLSESMMQRYESGQIKGLSVMLVLKLSDILDANPIYILGWEDKLDENMIYQDKDFKVFSNTRIVSPEIAPYLGNNLRSLTDEKSKRTEMIKFLKLTQLAALNGEIVDFSKLSDQEIDEYYKSLIRLEKNHQKDDH